MTTLAAIVLCAGKGTRMKSDKAKVLHKVLNRPLCAYPIARALELGAEPVAPVVGHQAEAVSDAIRSTFPGRKFLFALQRDQRGTADAVKSAQDALSGFKGPVLILYGDTPLLKRETLEALLEAYRKSNAPLAMIATTADESTMYGRVIRENGKVKRITEYKDCTPEQRKGREMNAGMYVVDSDFLWDALSRVKSQNAQGEYYLTDLVEMAAEKGDIAVVNADFIETAGVNDKAELAQVAKVLQERINTRLMKAGVSMVDPATAFIDEDIEIGADSEIGPMVTITQGSKIGRNVVIGQGSVISKSTVADDVQVKPYSVFEEAVVGRGSLIGPFARLRPGSELAEEVHIGNFVETKKTKIAKGSKANHLAYLGDAVIGSGVNVGAGTITCNYDGVNKHQTVLEDGVFIGSDTQLVAPVKVGKGAYVGAGTTVTQDVPEMALAISRAPQTNKEGWVARKKSKEAASKVSVKAG